MKPGRPSSVINKLRIEKKKQLTFNEIVSRARKQTKRHVRKVKPILKQTFFVETVGTLIDYDKPSHDIALQAVKLYARTMYSDPEAALEFAAIARAHGGASLAAAMEMCWQSTEDYVIRCPELLPKYAAQIDSKKALANAEYYIYKLLGQGKSLAEMSKILGRTQHSINRTIGNIKKKLKIRTLNQIRIHSQTVGKI